MESESLQLRDVVPAEPFIEAPPWPWWAWVLIGIGTVLVIGWIRISIKRAREPVPLDPGKQEEAAYRLAVEEIGQADRLPMIQEVATTCSAAIRRYLATVTGDPSLFETHEEFLARHAALDSYPEELRAKVAEDFSRLAKLKYGKSPSGIPSEIAVAVKTLLDQLHQHRPA